MNIDEAIKACLLPIEVMDHASYLCTADLVIDGRYLPSRFWSGVQRTNDD